MCIRDRLPLGRQVVPVCQWGHIEVSCKARCLLQVPGRHSLHADALVAHHVAGVPHDGLLLQLAAPCRSVPGVHWDLGEQGAALLRRVPGRVRV
eukprot:4143601-Alexandrium_andersonii.AAC.1